MAMSSVVEEFVSLLQGLELREWDVEDLILACDAINVVTEDIFLEIVLTASTGTKDHRAQEEVEEEDTILKTAMVIVSVTEGSMIAVTNQHY